MKKFIKAEHGEEKDEGKSTAAYARHEDDSGKGAKLAESLIAMSHAHRTKSASNKSIRNGFYGKKD